MAINGKYNLTIETPMGPFSGIITFRTQGKVIQGEYDIAERSGNFTGTVDGENAKWSVKTTDPMGGDDITLTFDAKVTPNDVPGSVVLGYYGPSSISGKKT